MAKPTLEKQREYSRRWREKNPDKYRQVVQTCNGRRKDKARAWRLANAEKLRQAQIAYRPIKNAKRRASREKALEYERRVRAEAPHKHREKKARRRARLAHAIPRWLTKAQREEIRDWYALAAMATAEVDHVIPLLGANVCGLHVPWNLQLLTRSENAAKGNRMPLDHKHLI